MTTKANTIPDAIENLANLSAWLKCYPFMLSNPRMWLKGVPISDLCKALYPDIVAVLQSESRPQIVSLSALPATENIAA